MSRFLLKAGLETIAARPCTDLVSLVPGSISVMQSRSKYWHNRHRDQRYRRERGQKFWHVELPDFDHFRDQAKGKLAPDEIRTKMKEKGIAPPSQWNEREMYQPCTMGVVEPYKPPEIDEKSSSILNKIKSPVSGSTDLFKNRKSLGSIRAYEGLDFDLKEFAKEAKDIYIKAHECLMSEYDESMFDYVTEHCWPMMTAGIKDRTLFWKYLDDIEEPRVVQVRTGELMSKTNKYAQITVRFHAKQMMEVYDRHGRLLLGSPTDVKEVLEYIVFEKYLANEYGLWRVHDRIRGSQVSYEPVIPRTQVMVASE